MTMKQLFLCLGLAASLFAFQACDDGSSALPTDGDAPVTCTVDEECGDGFYCLDGYCATASDGDGPSVLTCVDDWDCPIGQLCLDNGAGKKICKGIADGDDESETSIEGDKDPVDTFDGYDAPGKCPVLQVSPNQGLNFGAVIRGNSATLQLTITNNSNEDVDLNIFAITYDTTTQTADFQLELTQPEGIDWTQTQVLMRDQSGTLNITYTPSDEGIDEAYLTILSNDCVNPLMQVRLWSEYKGTAYLAVDPLSHDFGNVNIGDPAVTYEFKAWNYGDPTGNRILTISEVSEATGNTDYNFSLSFRTYDGQILNEINPYQPVMLPPGESYALTIIVSYTPQSMTDEFRPLSEEIFIFNDSEILSEQMTSLSVTGYAESATLTVFPIPIDFDECVFNDITCALDEDCPEGQTCLADHQCYEVRDDTRVFNWTANPVVVSRMDFQEVDQYNDCDHFYFVDSANYPHRDEAPSSGPYSIVPLTVQPDNVGTSFKVAYKCTEETIDGCMIRLEAQLPAGPQYPMYPMKGFGVPPNRKPTARVSLEKNSPPIEDPIEGVRAGTELKFYGKVSGDWDGQVVCWNWELTQVPTGSTARINTVEFTPGCPYTGMDTSAIKVKFDKGGDYVLKLTVMDDDEAWSEPEEIYLKINGNQGLGVILTFDGGDASFLGKNVLDMDLVIQDVIGATCSCKNLNINNGCQFPQNRGYVLFPQCAEGGGGGIEEARMTILTDGAWYTSAKYLNDCEQLNNWLVAPVCVLWGHIENNTYTMRFYDPNNWSDTTPFFPAQSSTLSQGESDTYLLIRENGMWTRISEL